MTLVQYIKCDGCGERIPTQQVRQIVRDRTTYDACSPKCEAIVRRRYGLAGGETAGR